MVTTGNPTDDQRVFERIFESSSAVQLLVDAASGALLDANPAAEAFYGWPRAAMRAMLLGDLEEGAEPASLLHIVSSGARRAVHTHRCSIDMQGRSVVHVFVHERAEPPAITSLPAAPELEEIARRVARIAHDFNNVLTVIRGAAGFLRDVVPAGSPHIADIETLERASDRAEALARQLFLLGRRDAGRDAGRDDARASPDVRTRDAPREAGAGAKTTSAPRAPTPPVPALLVEDESIMREIGRRMLESLGYAVTVVASGADALAVLERRGGEIALLVTDVVMPGMSGTDLVATAEQRFPGIAAVAITGYPVSAELRDTLAARNVPLLVKPFTRDALAAAVRAVARGAP